MMKSAPGTLILAIILLAVFGVEIATHRMGDETAWLRVRQRSSN